VTTPTDDYYELFGVDPSAPTSEIRERYRERRNELEAAGTDDAREETARLNRAWNVLSDPYQRGRYDAQRESGGDDVDVVDDDDVEIVDDEPPRRRRLFEPPPRGAARQPAPVVEYPNGLHAPENRRRIMAMVIDLFVLLVLFVGAQFVLQALINERYPDQVDEIERLTDGDEATDFPSLDDLRDRENDLEDQADNASGAERSRLEAQRDDVQREIDDREDQIVDIQKDFTGTYYAVVAAFVLVALAYLVVPSIANGQTLGKRLQRIRVVRADGSPLGFTGALTRYAPVVLITGVFLPTAFGQIVFVIVLIVLLGWMRNANRQGMHDRLARTIVVDAS
jgi:curved DNA-binding protein CbpA